MRYFIIALSIALLASCSAEKKALKNFRLAKYEPTIGHFLKKLKKNPNDGEANFYVAESYRLSNRIRMAEPFYAKASGRGIDRDTVLFHLAQAQEVNQKYDEARKTLESIIANSGNERLKDRAQSEINGIDFLEQLNGKTSYYKVKNLDLLNTPSAEYSPVFLNNELYFTSTRGGGKVYEAHGTPFSKLYKVASRGANVDLATLAPLPPSINTENVNDGTIAFSPDGKVMVFAKGNTGKRKGAADVDLYMSRFRNGSWTEPTPLNINDPDAWDSAPAFSPDGRTLYFSSNRKGRGRDRDKVNYGGLDIYAAQMDSRGRFSRVKNMGPDVNTPGNESFPYVAEDAKLYIASDGHPGYGGLDLFVVKRANGKTVVENLAQPMNSHGDDFGLFLFKADRGFFTSNREGGKGDDDIYTFINEDPDLRVVNYYLQGITYTPGENGQLQILPNTKVSIYDQEGEVMQDFVTGNDGKFLFRVYENEKYDLVGETDGYIIKRQPYTTVGKGVDPASLKDLVTNITLDTVLVLEKIDLNKYFIVENIYYDLDKSDIRPDAARELDKLVQMLKDNPEITKIELSSHTDSIASVEYNLDLSQRRAESAVRYMVQQGILKDRIVAKGYGELRPIARNTNPDGTDNPDGRQRNRRTEFKILEIGLVPKKDEDQEKDDKFDEDKYFGDDDGN